MTETFDNKEIIKPRHFGVIYGYRFPDGKWYVGQSRNMAKRHIRHKSRSNQYVWRAAWSKYGEQKYIILKICANQKEMDRCEQLFIRMHRAQKPYGYCLDEGGLHTRGSPHEETIALIRDTSMWNDESYDQNVVEEHRERRREYAKGNKNFRGHKHTQETKDIIREKMKVRVFTPEHRANISKAQTGKPISDKKRAALRAAQQRRWANTPMSDKTRKSISEANKRRWARWRKDKEKRLLAQLG